MYKVITPKTLENICLEWDHINPIRQNAILSGKDFSLFGVTVPNILKEIEKSGYQIVLDVGCGTGFLSNEIAKLVKECVGIDYSLCSIEIAKKTFQRNNLSFFREEISKFSYLCSFDACISNLVFMSDPDWILSIQSINKLLSPNGQLILTITHPHFWPKYCNFENKKWFNYNKELYLESDFKISMAPSMGRFTFIHRPFNAYVDGIESNGFIIKTVRELYPLIELPSGYKYEYPRFIMFICTKKEDINAIDH